MIITNSEIKKIKKSIDRLVDSGATKSHAISVIADKNGITAKKLNLILYKQDETDTSEYSDVKTSEGSYVVLKNDTNKIYEVIKFNNKESIILRDLKTNKSIKVKEEEILPIVTENVMKTNLKEANYNLSIDGLESVDAETLSQILSLAGQAESSSDTLGSEVTDPMGMGEIETVDMVDEPMTDDTSFEDDDMNTFVPEDDIYGDESMSDVSEDDIYGDESMSDDFGYEEYEQFPVSESKCVKEDVLLDPQSDDETYNSEIEEIDEVEDLTVGEEIVEETEDKDIENEEPVESDDFDDEIAECLRLAGVELNEVSDEDATKGKKDLPQVIGHKTAFSKAEKDGFKPGENQRPDYKCVKTKDVMGKEATEGTKEPLNVAKVRCNESAIKSICETAKRMYAKKEHSEWLALDRRYIEKLLNEGVGYERASKMLLKAKAGK